MIYLFETDIPNEKSVFSGLICIYGIGKSRSKLICKKMGFCLNLKIKKLSKKQINKLIDTIKSLGIEVSNDLKRTKEAFVNKLKNIKSYRGTRLINSLPVRGQRTHTNSKTARKKRQVIKTVKKTTHKKIKKQHLSKKH